MFATIKKGVLIFFTALVIVLIGMMHSALKEGRNLKELFADVVEMGRVGEGGLPFRSSGGRMNELDFGTITIFDLPLQARSFETRQSIPDLLDAYESDLKKQDVPTFKHESPGFGLCGGIVKEDVHAMIAFQNLGTDMSTAFVSELPYQEIIRFIEENDVEQGDLPGEDIVDVPRFPGSQRVFYMKKDFGRNIESILSYDNPASFRSTLDYHLARMQGQEWERNPVMDEMAHEKEGGPSQMLLFSKDKSQCMMMISREGNERKTNVTFLHKQVK